MAASVARPLVGVGVLVQRGSSILVGQRLGSHGAGTWALPGGHLELGESFEQCAARELEEETGISSSALGPISFAYAVNSVFDERKHYVTVFVRTRVADDVEAHVTEPDKCAEWRWVGWDEVPKPVFLPLQLLLDSPFKLV